MSSSNSGFVFVGDGTRAVVKLRLDGEVCKARFDESGKPDVPIDDSVAAIVWTVFNQYRYLY